MLPAGVPLRLRVTKTVPLHVGSSVTAILQQPVYVRDQLALSTGTVLHGTVEATEPASRLDRTKAWLNGDLTSQRAPVVTFTSFEGEHGAMPLNAEARIRNTQWVRFVPEDRHRNLWQKQKAELCDRVEAARAMIFDPGRGDRALRAVYAQLPYHPQRIWAGTEMIADLLAPGASDAVARPATPLAPADLRLNGLHVRARLTAQVSSNGAKKDDTVTAIVTEPVFDASGALVLPEGSQMQGRVLQVKPARSFGRNGHLAFAFMSVQREGEEAQHAHGVLTAAGGAKVENLRINQEGEVESQPQRNRFLAPLLLGALTLAGSSNDDNSRNGHRDNNAAGQVVAAGGFGFVGRVLAGTLQNAHLGTAFGAFGTAKSVGFRFLAPGKPVVFERDTMVEVALETH